MDFLRDNNYIVIQPFMVRDLDLKGNELIVYALINGFCQDNQSYFYGSLEYISQWTNATKQTTINVLNSLIDKGLIVKEQIVEKGITYNRYSKKLTNLSNSFNGNSQKIIPNNIIIKNNKENIIKEKTLSTETNSILSTTPLKSKVENKSNNSNKCITQGKTLSQQKPKSNKVFIAPTRSDVREYAEKRKRGDLADKFFDYYDATEWTRRDGKPVLNWKAQFLTWENYNTKPSQPTTTTSTNPRAGKVVL